MISGIKRITSRRVFLFAFWACLFPVAGFSQITLNHGNTAAELANTITGNGVQILNPQLTCADSAYGTYTIANFPNFTTGSGVILTTGKIENLRGPNNTEAKTTINNTPGDALITTIAGNNSFDACILEFDVVPVGDTLRFNFTFASEEYDEYVGTPFNDAFGFFISGPGIIGDPGLGGLQNIALIPGTSTPVEINSVNNGNPDIGFPATNPQFYFNNPLGLTAPIQYDAWTRHLFARKVVTPCDTFSLKLVIADVADPEWDSAVLIEAIESNSVVLDQNTAGGIQSTIEGCNNGQVTFTRTPVTEEPFTVTYFVTGSAENGVDYEQIGDDPDPQVPKTIIIPANQASATIDIVPFDDGIDEGEEFINIYVGNPLCPGTIQDSIQVTINDSLGISINPSLSFVCLGDNLTFDVTGDENASYAWSPATYLNNTNIKEPTTTPLTDITYTLTATAASCVSSTQVEVNVSNVNLSASQTNVLCAGEVSGSINLTISGGETPYEIEWVGPAGFTSTQEDISGLTPGIYNVLVTDRDGCTETLTVTITEVPAISLSLSSPVYLGGNNVSCNNASDGQATVSVSGGTPPYTFLWNDALSQTTQTATGLFAGTYEVIVTDANGCEETGTITLTAPDPVIGDLISKTDVLCTGENTGAVTIEPLGGTPPYNIVWNTFPSQSGPTAVNLAAGIYTAEITDANGCQGTLEVEIVEPDEELDATLTVSQPSCAGGSDGSALVSVTGGTLPYTYSWSADPALNTPLIENLSDGSYNVTITDGNGCSITIPFNINAPELLEINIANLNPPSCNGFSDGSITVAASGGTAPYSYVWDTDPVTTGNSLSNLEAGTYGVSVLDANGCEANLEISLGEPEILELSLINQLNPTCNGLEDGSISVEATGGTAPYNYSWNTTPPTSGPDLNGVGAGDYIVTVVDSEGCIANFSTSLTNPAPIQITVLDIENVLCAGQATGSITIEVNGGTPDYTILWNDPSNQTGTTASSLSAGNYTATVEDANGCIEMLDVAITEPDLALGGQILTVTDVLCFGENTGSATVTGTGGSGSYSYSWNDPQNQQTSTASNLSVGTYQVIITDNNGCADPFVLDVTINGPAAPLEVTLVPSTFGGGFNVACAGDSTATIDLTISGGTPPYTILWNLPGLDTSTDEDLANLGPGTYSVSVTDANGCVSNAEITLTAPEPIEIDFTMTPSLCFGLPQGAIELEVFGGQAPYSVDWTGPGGFTGTGLSLDNLQGGVYNLTIEDANGCIYLDAITVTQPEDLVITVDSLSNYDGFNTTCWNSSDGAIFITPSGGTPPYSYQWNTSGDPNFSNQQDVINLSPGTYESVLFDANGCVQNSFIDLIGPDTLEIDFNLSLYPNGFNISCFGAADGSAEAVVSGGTAPYNFIWIGEGGFGPAFGNPIENLSAGEYSVLVQDANNCSFTESVILVQPDEFEINLIAEIINGNNVSCAGENDGSINLIISGGSAPFIISWTGPNGFTSTSEDLFNLEAGEYCVTVTDGNNCTQNQCITLTEPVEITAQLNPFVFGNGFNVSCEGAADGEIALTLSGGTAPYSFSWTGPGNFTSTAQNLSGLEAGEYCVTITDLNGCEFSICETLLAPEGIEISEVSVLNILCAGESTGAITVSVDAGVAPFSYSWTGPDGFSSSDQNISGIPAGTYCLEVTDANNCTGEECFTVVQNPVLTANISTSAYSGGFEIDCAGNENGSITAAATGGVGPYSFSWTGPDGFVSNSNELTGLAPGQYCLTLIDNNGCEYEECIEIQEPTELTSAPSVIIPDCADGSTATINLNVSGGTPPYTFNWSSGDDSETVELGEGDYSVVISDANGCVSIESFTIVIPSPIQLSFDVPFLNGGVNISCFGDLTGEIDLTITGATGITMITWTGPNGFSASTEDVDGLGAGEYCVEVVDELGCSADGCVVLTEPSPVNVDLTEQNVDCFGGSNGQIEATITGGIPSYTISWTGPGGFSANGTSIANLTAGTYCATATDANGCTAQTCIDVTEPSELNISLFSPEDNGFNIACFGDNTGIIEATITGGTMPYSYSWTGPGGYASSQQNISNLFAGEYCLTITDENGCELSECITLTQAPGLNIVFDVFEYPNGFNTSCGDICDGSIDLSVTGGAAPLSYAWTGPLGFASTSEDLSDLCAGTYTITITDANDCVQSASVSLTEPQPIEIDLDSPTFGGGFEISCFGENTGSILSEITGGIGDLTLSWSGPNGFSSNQEDLSQLFAGEYTLTVTDANGCSSQESITLNEPSAPLQATAIAEEFPSGDNISCFGADDGSINTEIIGGTPPYSFNWDGPDGFSSGNEDLSNLAPGEYTLVVEDANSCVFTVVLELTEPDSPVTSSVQVVENILCPGDSTGSAEVTASGGSGQLSILWIGPNNFTATDFTIEDLNAGTYTFVVEDENGCTSSGAVTLVNPQPVTVSAEILEPNCVAANGAIDLTVSGGTQPYMYEWNTGAESQDLISISEGEYSVIITDANGCTAEESFNVTSTNPLDFDADITEPSCFGDSNGAIELTSIEGEEPVQFSWSGPNGFADTGSMIINIVAGEYTVSATDANGCQLEQTYFVNQPDSLEIDELESPLTSEGYNLTGFRSGDGIINNPEVSGGTPPYQILTTGPNGYEYDEFGNQNGLSAGTYIVTITDANQCTATDSITLTQPVPIELPNGISPNGDGFNDFLLVRGLELFPDNNLIVFNRWGNIVYEEQNYRNSDPWYGLNESGEELPEGTYFVVVELEGRDNLRGYLEVRR